MWRYAKSTRACAFGRFAFGDGNIHYAVSASTADPAIKNAIMQCVEDIVLDLGGSFSAEHGIGQAKLPSMRRAR